jgi:metal-responsive CopG/Arc/MetJ family transcriptional regulator
MRIGEVLDALATPGNTVARVAKEQAGIGEKRLRTALNTAGYEFRNKGQKGWFYIGEGQEPLDKNLSDYVTGSNTTVRSTASTSNKRQVIYSRSDLAKNHKGMQVDHTLGEIQFTREELTALKEMIQEYIKEKRNQTPRDRLHIRIMKLEKEERTTKTVVISESVAQKFDDFAEKMRFNKSDILELALMDFISSYDQEE